jgi:hypothetical protein
MPAFGAADKFFQILVVDDETGRGVPLVELRTVNSTSYLTDSQGLIAFQEPGLMDQEVFFHIQSHGYEYPKDGFDNRGVKLRIKPGGSARIQLKRLNIAERLYRITGQGIYRDSQLLGQGLPLKQPVLNGQVMGQDTVIATPYRGKIYWFWGDTDRVSYPLGNFGASGATSEIPGHGGLNPEAGVDLTYFVDGTGFSKPMCPNFGPGLQWIESLLTLRDKGGAERLIARVASADGLVGTHGWHVAVFNDQKQIFESVAHWEIHESHDVATPFRAFAGSNEYFYLYPNYRVKADFASVTNLSEYEAFTCLADGAKYQGGTSVLDRAPDGRLRYEWRRNADRLTGSRVRELVKSGAIKTSEAWRQLHDVETGELVQGDRGSVCWNSYRGRWVMITSGRAGEIWFAEADTPLGPWAYARRVVAHHDYNFYNPTQHPFFDQDNGRQIYFEGTYTDSFSNAKAKTPRYDYNQIMYRLRLDDRRLALPCPVYAVRESNGIRWMMRAKVETARAWNAIESAEFFAVPPSQAQPGLVPIYATSENGTARLQERPSPGSEKSAALFFALPSRSTEKDDSLKMISSAVAPLYEFRREGNAADFVYATQSELADPAFIRSKEPLCRVWKNPMSLLLLDRLARPVLAETR